MLEKKKILKHLISQWSKVNKLSLKAQCNVIINNTERKLKDLGLDEELIRLSTKALHMNFYWWYQQMIVTLEKTAKIDTSGIVKDTLKAMKDIKYKSSIGGFTIVANGKDAAMGKVEVTNLRELMTVYEVGSAGRYVDYVGKIKESLVDIQNKIADGSLSTIDKLGRKKSIRNMAEIKTRYDLINEDLSKLKDKGVNFVVATSHANASERCSWWQGKIFKIDDGFDIATREMGQYKGKPDIKKLGTIDGKPYYSLKQACENGFLSYNCQHRVVAYYKGIKVPKYNLVDIKKKRALTSKQRYLENKIRKAKTRQALAVSPEERQKAINDSKRLQKEYEDFCGDNKLPRYDWRCRVTEVERGVSPVFEEKYKEQKQTFDNNILSKSNNSGKIVVSGGVFGALDSESQEAEEHANRYYGSVRKMKTDAFKISQNTGIELDKVKAVKQHVFLNEYNLNGTTKRFDPNYDMAQAWQRLIEGKNIKESDYILLEHEFLEYTLMQKGMDYVEAHLEANKKFNWFRKMREEKNNVKD